ncbi:MAG: YigZ family protein [Phycisphaerae bacterium]
MAGYLIPKSQVRVEIKVSNSRFVATAAPVFSVKEAHEFVRQMRQEMPDANHHVYAFKIGFGASVSEGMSDDGEPSGTSGPPALAVLRGSGVGDVVLVITRFFGGTKLGTGGLVQAYTAAAQEAFKALPTEEKIERATLRTGVPYALLELVRWTINEHEGEVLEEVFEADVVIVFKLPREREDGVRAALRDLSNGAIQPAEVDDEAL